MCWLRTTILVLFVIHLAACRYQKFFRKDYTYIEEYDAFYKMHVDLNGVSWRNAFMACDNEGAQLFYPKETLEWQVAGNLSDAADISSEQKQIFLGYHNEYNLGQFITIDGSSTSTPLLMNEPQRNNAGEDSCVTMNIETGVHSIETCDKTPETILPFICKKEENEFCPTVDSGYKYRPGSNKCFKVHDRLKMWQEAMHTCFMEGGTLAVIENEEDKKIIRSLIEYDHYYFIGFNRLFRNEYFYTVHGKKLNIIDGMRWEEPDSGNDCGILRLYNDMLYVTAGNCMQPREFICQMDMN